MADITHSLLVSRPKRRLFGRSAPAPSAQPARTVRELEDWMAAWLAPKLGVTPESIDREAPFTEYGLDSMAAVTLSGKLEQFLGQPVSPSIAWEHPSVAAVARELLRSQSDVAAGDLDAE